MLEQLSDRVRECLECAANARAKADASNDPALRAQFLDMEKHWLILARSHGFTESLADFTKINSERQREFDGHVRANTGSTQETRADQSTRPASIVESSDGWLDGILQLREITTSLIAEENFDALYNRIIDAAVVAMSSDMASMQLLDPKRNQLRLLAWKGFHPRSAAFWEWVYLDSASTCGLALSAGSRVVVPDIETCDFMAGTADLDEYRRSNIRAVQSTPLISRSGQLLGTISTHWREPHQLTEVALRRLDVLARQAADLVESSRPEVATANGAATVLAKTPFLLTRCSSDLRYLFVSEAYARMLGRRPEDVIGKKIIEVMGVAGFNTILPHMKAVLAGQRVEYETDVHFKDIGLRLLHVIYTPDKDPLGNVNGWVASIIDITERKQTEAALRESEQQLYWLAREAQHRTKNILATVQATVNLSHADTPEGLKQAVQGRVQALANVHNLFVKARWAGAELSSIVAQELSPYRASDEARVRIDGPDVLLVPNTAQAIAVTLHELATNAAKYGSLSMPKGRVEVIWSLAANGQLILRWTESGGPPPNKPGRAGFGTHVIGRMIREQLKGEMHLEWRAEGLACKIVFSM